MSAAEEKPKQGAAEKPARKKRRKSKAGARRKTARPRAKALRVRKVGRRGPRRSEADRARILATAGREGLTGAQVAKRFGISQVTYYVWRKKAGKVRSRSGRMAGVVDSAPLRAEILRTIQARAKAMIPAVVAQELDRFLATAFGGTSGRRAKR